MNRETIFVKYGKRRKKLNVIRLSFFGMIRGLMFRRKGFKEILLFDFNKKIGYGIHSYFVFFDFLAVWLDDKNNAREIKMVKGFKLKIKPKKPFYRLIEIPVQKSNKKLIDFFVGKRNI